MLVLTVDQVVAEPVVSVAKAATEILELGEPAVQVLSQVLLLPMLAVEVEAVDQPQLEELSVDQVAAATAVLLTLAPIQAMLITTANQDNQAQVVVVVVVAELVVSLHQAHQQIKAALAATADLVLLLFAIDC